MAIEGEENNSSPLTRILEWFGLERDIFVMVVAVLVLTMGNQVWIRYIPKYLEYLGAGALIIGLYGFIERLVGAIYQYPGGALADRIGSKNALILFSLISIIGYAIYYFSPGWEFIILGTFFVLVWESMSSPAIFSLIGEALSKSKRAMGFSVQSILKRVPIVLAPPIGGYLIQSFGLREGMKIGFIISILTAVLAIVVQKRFYTRISRKKVVEKLRLVELWTVMDQNLKRLLISDILARTASYMVKVYVVLYVLNVIGAPPIYYGFMISIQMTTSILGYLPAAKLADIYGRKPFVTATFLFFALFPLALVSVKEAWLLPLAFIVAGLREIGEPARKALIVDLAGEKFRGRIIGLYYLIREFTTMPAPLIGGFLWLISPETPFYTAFAIGALGVLIFTTTRLK
ncbi:MAG: MFS transporter [Thermoprotei archaeon]|nr:MAG: MFS transporter [Thermoprotei archaeon]